MNDPKLSAIGRRAAMSPDLENVWEDMAKKQKKKTGSGDQAKRYANHITKAAIHRKMKKQQQKPKGPFSG